MRRPYTLPLCPAVLTALLFVLAACDSSAPSPYPEAGTARGSILEADQIERLAVSDVSALGFPVAVQYDVELYRLVYRTIGPSGGETQASGMLALPLRAGGPLPLVSYQHGTETARDHVASERGSAQPEALIAVIMASGGYLAVMPDYLGLGASPGLHPYVHARSLATATVDMLRAARRFAGIEGVALNGQVFLAGYSEGGLATAAAHRLIEAEHADEFTLTASAPMAGPYDMSGVMVDLMLSREPYDSPHYLPYTLLAYDAVYGIYPDLSDAFVPPYDADLPGLFDGTHGGGFIDDRLPDVPIEVARPAYVQAFVDDPGHPLRQALRDNDVYDWTPRAPMRLYHCREDDLIPFENAVVARDRFLARGATDVELVELDAGGHVDCVGPALLLGKAWFDTFVQADAGAGALP